MEDHNLESLSFEDALNELQRIVTRLEQGNLPMEESLVLFERGTRLARLCQLRLDQAELRVAQLTRQDDGQIATTPFEPPT